jgi:hypothetical protein
MQNAPWTLETSASPAGLTARARPKARPGRRAANPRNSPDAYQGTDHKSSLTDAPQKV